MSFLFEFLCLRQILQSCLHFKLPHLFLECLFIKISLLDIPDEVINEDSLK